MLFSFNLKTEMIDISSVNSTPELYTPNGCVNIQLVCIHLPNMIFNIIKIRKVCLIYLKRSFAPYAAITDAGNIKIYLVDSILKLIDCLVNTKISYLVSDNDATSFGNFRK